MEAFASSRIRTRNLTVRIGCACHWATVGFVIGYGVPVLLKCFGEVQILTTKINLVRFNGMNGVSAGVLDGTARSGGHSAGGIGAEGHRGRRRAHRGAGVDAEPEEADGSRGWGHHGLTAHSKQASPGKKEAMLPAPAASPCRPRRRRRRGICPVSIPAGNGGRRRPQYRLHHLQNPAMALSSGSEKKVQRKKLDRGGRRGKWRRRRGRRGQGLGFGAASG